MIQCFDGREIIGWLVTVQPPEKKLMYLVWLEADQIVPFYDYTAELLKATLFKTVRDAAYAADSMNNRSPHHHRVQEAAL